MSPADNQPETAALWVSAVKWANSLVQMNNDPLFASVFQLNDI